MSEKSQDRAKIFRLFQHKEEVTIGTGEDSVKVVLWKPTNEQASRGQLYLLERMEFWQGEGGGVTDSIISVLSKMSKDDLIGQILDQTVAQRVAENLDLVPEDVRVELERDLLRGMSAEFLDSNFGLQPGGHIALEQASSKAGFNRNHVLSLIRKTDEFEEVLDKHLADKIDARFRQSEAEQYAAASRKDLEATLGQLNARTVAYGMALREWTHRMISELARYPCEEDPTRKGDLVFSADPESEEFVGNVSEEVVDTLTQALGTLMNLGRTEQVRRLATDPNFPGSVTSPSSSDSLPPDVLEPPTLQTTPST